MEDNRSLFESLLGEIEIPRFCTVRRRLPDDRVSSIPGEIDRQLWELGLLEKVCPGQTVCLTVGSREVADILEIIRSLVSVLQARGAKPFIIPAMGSHGGASAEGQREIVNGWGITEESVGAPIRATMDTVLLGTAENGLPAYMDRFAYEADWIVPVGRIKPHTDFHGPIESGIMKMITIGMGKQHGASICHSQGFGRMSENVRAIARFALKSRPFLFGVGVIENAHHHVHRLEIVPPEAIDTREPQLLEIARSLMPHFPFEKADVLIVDEIGKNISGPGMDPNVIGRSTITGRWTPNFDAIMVRDLTEESHHNGNGIGMADVTTVRFFEKYSFAMSYPNSITAIDPVGIKVPAVMPNDELALKYALRMCTPTLVGAPRIIWIHNTLCMEQYCISEALLPQARAAGMEVLSAPTAMKFDADGNITPLTPLG